MGVLTYFFVENYMKMKEFVTGGVPGARPLDLPIINPSKSEPYRSINYSVIDLNPARESVSHQNLHISLAEHSKNAQKLARFQH